MVWDTASQNTKGQDMLEILRGYGPNRPPGYAYMFTDGKNHTYRKRGD